ncbi:MAG TPA: hypothetical protein VF170_00695 [Planctomycetaceae bacterium]
MKDFVLTQETAKTTIGELLRGADEEISVRDEFGELIALITPTAPDEAETVRLSEEELAIVRRRLASDPANDLSLEQLLDRLRSRDTAE